MLFHKLKTLPLLTCIALIAASCGTSPLQTESEIATAVAQTVQAQDSLTKVSALPTLTPAPALPATAMPEPDPTNTPGQVVSNPGCIASAGLVSESPPDDTIFLPGEYFWKTWTFLNTGTCIWDKSYSLVFWDGEQMGGLVSYPLSDIIEPQETMEISVYLQAPATEGTATGYWRLKAPWGRDFGVGPLDSSFYVRVGVSSNPKYGVTHVDYQLVRDPAKDCPINVRYIVYATVTTNGPLTFEYFWNQSDGNESGFKKYEIKEAGSVTFKREWMISLNDSPNPRWIKFIVTEPEYQDYGPVVIDHDCFKLITPSP
ncbi:MAG TPA: NBR1-Ig-like domain-containing protein [Anaerolineales bacterium]|nr:NBR1-Ig-like domain-containing protein [Anaerolineales bacterium]